MDFAFWLTVLAFVIAGASALARVLKPLVEWTDATWDNKVVKVLTWLGDKLLPLLNGLALNPKAPKPPNA